MSRCLEARREQTLLLGGGRQSGVDCAGGNMGDPPAKDRVPARYVLCLMLFLGLMVTFMLRVNINLAIVSMASAPAGTDDAGTGNSTCQRNTEVGVVSNETGANVTMHVGEFDWDEMQQSIVLSSFFWGYLLFQIPGGRVAEVYGTKRVFGGAIFINGILALALPLAAHIHWTLLLAIRMCQGLAQGVLFPALSASVALWVPLEERARFVSFAVQGASLGVVVSLPLCGSILAQWGWEAVFYVSGALALLWTLAWNFLVYDSPEQHPRISPREKSFILDNLNDHINQKSAVPWKAVVTSFQFWIGCVAAFGNDWGFHTFTTLVPKYITGSLGFDPEMSSWLTSLPFLCQYIFAILYGTLVDTLLKHNVALRKVRKLSVIVSHIVPAVLLVALSMAGCNLILSIVLLTMAVTAIGAFSSGFYQNPLDIAPNFAGSLTGIMNGIGSGTGAISTPVAGLVLQASGAAGWPVIFLIAAAMYTICSLPYLIFATSTVQPWNDAKLLEDKEKQVHMIPMRSDDIKETDKLKFEESN